MDNFPTLLIIIVVVFVVRPLGEIDISKNNLRRVDSLSTLREEALHMHKVHQGKIRNCIKSKSRKCKKI